MESKDPNVQGQYAPSGARRFVNAKRVLVVCLALAAAVPAGVNLAAALAEEPPVTASFDQSPGTPLTGQTVTFTSTSTTSVPENSIVTEEWDLDDDGQFDDDSGSTAQRSFSQAGSYTISLHVVDNLGNEDVASNTVQVANRPPTASFSVSPNPASTGQTVSFDGSGSSDPETSIARYEWDLDGDGSYERDTGTDATTSRSYSSAGAFSVGLRVTDGDGDTDTATKTLTIDDRAPTASFSKDPNPALTGQTVSFDGSGSSDPDGTITKYEWDLDGNGSFETDTGTTATTSRSYSSAASLTVKLRVTDDGGNQDTATSTLTIASRPPTASFTVSPTPGSIGQTISFDASGSSDPDGTISNYEWDLDGNGSFETDTNATATTSRSYAVGGTINVGLRVTDNGGERDTTSRLITINDQPPTASFTISPNPATTGQTVNFNGSGSSDPDGSIAKYEWDLDGDGSFEKDTGTDATTSRSYTTAGGRTISLRVTDSGGAKDTTTRTLTITDRAPTASFTITPNPALIGQAVGFNGSGSSDPDGSITKYEWDLDGNGIYETNTGAVATATGSYASAGTRTIGLHVTDDAGNVSEANRTLTVEAGPTASLSVSPNPASTGQTVSFDGSGSSDSDGTVTRYEWDLDGNGTFEKDTSSTATTSRSYTTGGTLDVKLRVTDSDGHKNTISRLLTINDRPPTASFTISPNPATTGQTVNFDGSGSSDPDGSIAKYEWDLDGDGSFERDTGTDATTSRTYASAGALTVRLRVTDDAGGQSSASRALTVNTRAPTAAMTATPNPVLIGRDVAFDGSGSSDPDGTIAKYEWDLDGDGSFETDTGSTASTSRSYSATGTVQVKLRVTDNDGGTGQATRFLVVHAPPVASFTASPNPAASGQTVSFNGSGSSDPDGTITRYEWDLDGNGTFETDTSGTSTTSRSHANAGTIQVGLRVTDNHSYRSTTTHAITIENRPPTASFNISSNPALTGQTVTFSSNSTDPDGTITKYEWDLDGDGSFDAGKTTATVTSSYSTFGSRTVKLRITDSDGGMAETTRALTVRAPPVASFTVSPPRELTGRPVTFDASGSTDPDGIITRYEWDLDGSGSFETSEADPVVSRSYSSAGDYAIKLRLTDDHGNVSQPATITLFISDRSPIALFAFSPDPALTGQVVSFDASESSDLDGSITKYEWDLDGNGTFETDGGTSPTTSRAYPTAGSVKVKLRVTDNTGKTGLRERTLTVQDRPPVASFTASPNPVATGALVSFNGSASSDPDGTIVNYEWDLDGSGSFETDTNATPTASRSYAVAGPVAVRMRITDNAGNRTIATLNVDVTNRPPTASFSVSPDFAVAGQPPITVSGQPVTFNSTSTDPDGTIATYEWDLDGDGIFDVDKTTASVSTTYATFGTVTVKLRVTDDAGGVNEVTRVVTIQAPPVASFTIAPNPALINQTVTFDASASRDPEPLGKITKYEWDLNGDGNFDSGKTTAKVTSSYSTAGPRTITLQVTDQQGHKTIATQTMSVNSRPVNAGLTYTPESSLTGETVTFRSTSRATGTDNEIVSHRWDLDGNGTYETDTGKTPEASRSYSSGGGMTVRLEVKDKFENVGTVSAEITILNRPPVASFNYFPAGPHTGEAVSFVSTASDPDGRIVDFAWDLDGDGNYGDATGRSAERSFGSPGSYNVGLRVTDNLGAVSFQSQAVVVTSPPPPPAPASPGPAADSGRSATPTVLNPFPVVRIAGTITSRGVRLRRLSVDAPPDSTITVRCGGRRCPTRRLTKVTSAKPTTKERARSSGQVIRFRRFERRLLSVGVKVEVFITKPGMVGKYTRFKVKKGKPPTRVDRCLAPGTTKPTACPGL